jgi:hypothetical protein
VKNNKIYKLYFDRTVLTDIHIQHNRPDIIILNKQQKQAYLLDIAVPNSHNITQTYNTKINKYLELSVAIRNLWCLEKICTPAKLPCRRVEVGYRKRFKSNITKEVLSKNKKYLFCIFTDILNN